MNQHEAKYLAPFVDLQRVRRVGIRHRFFLNQHLRRMTVTAPFNFVGDIADFEHMRSCLEIGNEGTDTRDALDISFVTEFAQRAIGGHARNTRRIDQFVL